MALRLGLCDRIQTHSYYRRIHLLQRCTGRFRTASERERKQKASIELDEAKREGKTEARVHDVKLACFGMSQLGPIKERKGSRGDG
jgi:hypothetical protein